MARRVVRLERARKEAPARKRESWLGEWGEKGDLELGCEGFALAIGGSDGRWRNAMVFVFSFSRENVAPGRVASMVNVFFGGEMLVELWRRMPLESEWSTVRSEISECLQEKVGRLGIDKKVHN